jgi:hypothetical protein
MLLHFQANDENIHSDSETFHPDNQSLALIVESKGLRSREKV